MPDNKVVPLGTIHISLPFKSMDDVHFSGAYAPLADKLVDTLKEHLSKQSNDNEEAPEETNSDQSEDSDEQDDSTQSLASRLNNAK